MRSLIQTINLALLILASTLFTTTSTAAGLEQVIAGKHRLEENRARDSYRHPRETLEFFGLRPDMHVLEILPGGGWYTEILAPYLRDQGLLTVANYDPDSLNDYFRTSLSNYNAKLDADPENYGKINRTVYSKAGKYLADVADNSVDMILNTRTTHNMIRSGGLEEAYAAFYRVLKPGGILGVVQHRAPDGSDAEESAKSGYVPEDFLISFCEGLGFRLEGKSEINANPRDTRDYPKGVWTLPPSYRLGDEDRAKYRAIGESDRMTLRFIKP